jgi:transcriptional regulator NrdR family protein
MFCPHCKNEIGNLDMSASIAVHDETKIDLCIKCNNCGKRCGMFISQEDLALYDEKED